jgi:hypothetical protein
MSGLAGMAFAAVSQTPAADYSTKQGYLVDLADNVATISTSASVRAKGVILEGSATTGYTQVGILGAYGSPVYMKTGGAITRGAWVQQSTDGTVVTDAGSGARVVVGVALETAVSGDLILVAPTLPLSLS